MPINNDGHVEVLFKKSVKIRSDLYRLITLSVSLLAELCEHNAELLRAYRCLEHMFLSTAHI